MPIADPWTRAQAAHWWRLHVDEDEIVRDCLCPPVEELTHHSDEYAAFAMAEADEA